MSDVLSQATPLPGAVPEVFGQGAFRYEVLPEWVRLPEGWSLREVAGIGVDARDNVYVFNRGEHPVIVFDRAGNVLRSWGEGVFRHAHGLHMAPDATIYLTDDGDHTVRRYTLEGRLLSTLGTPGVATAFMCGDPFCRPTHTALAPSGELYVSDGYGNARIHKYDPDGRYLFSWGGSGIGPGEFTIPHNIVCDEDGWVYVADRESHRVQVFDGYGRYETEWNHLHRPAALFMPPNSPVCFVGELGPLPANTRYHNLGPRISVVGKNGRLLSRIGGMTAGHGPADFIGPHGIAADTKGDVYVGEVSRTFWSFFWPDIPVPAEVRCLRKLRRVPVPECDWS